MRRRTRPEIDTAATHIYTAAAVHHQGSDEESADPSGGLSSRTALRLGACGASGGTPPSARRRGSTAAPRERPFSTGLPPRGVRARRRGFPFARAEPRSAPVRLRALRTGRWRSRVSQRSCTIAMRRMRISIDTSPSHTHPRSATAKGIPLPTRSIPTLLSSMVVSGTPREDAPSSRTNGRSAVRSSRSGCLESGSGDMARLSVEESKLDSWPRKHETESNRTRHPSDRVFSSDIKPFR
jgi:hypothetical protein